MSEQEAFEPSAPEGERPSGGQYVSKRDVKIMVLGMVGITAILYPVYLIMKANTDKTICVSNSNQIYKAVSLYATDHDDRFPPLYAANADGTPMIDGTGLPYTWISDVSQFMGKGTFVCPSSVMEENAQQQSKDSGKPIASSYGMYAAYGAFPRYQVENPDQTVLFAETSNHGSKGTFDPLPLGEKDDGFVIGWANTNTYPNKDSVSVTRLAFRDTAKGLFSETGSGRHGSKLNFISASGEKSFRTPDCAIVKMRDNMPSDIWNAPIQTKPKSKSIPKR